MTTTQPTEDQLRVTPEFLKALKSTVRLPSSRCMSRALVVRRSKLGSYTVEVCCSTYAPAGSSAYSHDDRFTQPARGQVHNYDGANLSETQCVAQQAHYGYEGPRISTLASLAKLLKVGDTLYVYFIIGNSSENTKSVGWVRDEAYITIYRNVTAIATFTVDTYVGPNNSARMTCNY